MSRKSRALPPSPFRRFNSSPEVIRLVVLMYVRVSHEPIEHQPFIEASEALVRIDQVDLQDPVPLIPVRVG